MPLLETRGAASVQGFGALAASARNYIEDCFSCFLYTGNGSTQTITNGIDLSGKGGLTWIKSRNDTYDHYLYDTLRGATKSLQSDTTTAEQTYSDSLTAFNSNGFALGANVRVNANTTTYASWTFRKQPKFFDVVTYTGNGVAGRTVSHSLGSVPGVIIIKETGASGQGWAVYHRSEGNTKALLLNATDASFLASGYWNTTTPTNTVFTLGSSATVNANGATYVAYLFAHDAGGFGQSGSDNVISCGSFTTDGSGNATVNLGWEPQFLLTKASGSSGNWNIADVMRGMSQTGVTMLAPNTTAADNTSSGSPYLVPTATGFTTTAYWASQTHIYIAIRRGPMKTPTTGTSVYSAIARTGTGADVTSIGSVGFASDLAIISNTDKVATTANSFMDRLRGGSQYLDSTSTAAENSLSNLVRFDNNNSIGLLGTLRVNGTSYPYINWLFRRAPGFFDEVCYTGTGVARTVTHNLGVTPELMIVKARSITGNWVVYYGDVSKYMRLNAVTEGLTDLSNVRWNNTSPTASVFTVGINDDVNLDTYTFVAYLFATCPGVSKVGSYTGTGNTLQIDCGFTGGARFVLIKRTDSTGDWYVWDSARGIVAGNDPYLLLNSTAAEVTTTDWVDTHSPGFELSNAVGNNVNINTASYIFLAIA